MKVSSSWKANSCSATQEIISILWKRKVQYCIQKNRPTVSISWVRWIQPTLSHPVSLRWILILFCNLAQVFPEVSSWCFLIKILYAFLSSPLRACVFIFSSLILLCQQYLSRNKNYGAPNYANVSSIFLLVPFKSKYPSYNPVIKHP